MARSKAELDALSTLDPEIDAIIKSGKLRMPPMDWSDSHKAVLQMRQLMQAWEKTTPMEGVVDSKSSYTTRDNFQNRLLVFRPAAVAADQKLPLVVNFHGGGGAIGSPESSAQFCQNLALKQNAVVVSPSYRLAPEHPFPTGIDDSWDCFQHLANGGAEALGADPKLGFVIGGHSNGAAIASVIALRARDEGTSPRLTGLYFGAAGFFDPSNVPKGYEDQYLSREDEACVNAPILDQPTKKMFDDVYAPDQNSAWYRAGNYKGDAGLKDLPRTYFQVCGMDILRDDSLIFEDILRKGGVETKLDIYPGCPHVFWSVFSMISQYQKWTTDTQQGFTWLLSGR